MAVTGSDKLQLLNGERRGEKETEEAEKERGNTQLRGMPMLGHTIQVMRH